MKKECEFIINKIYPDDWEKYNEKEQEKKEKEFGVALFFLNNYYPIRETFKGANCLCVESHEGPDFFVSSNEESSEIFGLEITDCYINTEHNRNFSSVHSDLEKVCKEVINDIKATVNINSYKKINYISATFTHEVMTGEYFDKKRLKSELRDFIFDKSKHNGEYVCQVDVGYSAFYPENFPKILVYSNMAYIVPRICDVVQMQKEAGIDDNDPVLRSIAVKEKKLVDYKLNCKSSVHEWWLCINIPKSAFMNPISYHLPKNFTSKYDKIFLVAESFYGCGVHKIYGT